MTENVGFQTQRYLDNKQCAECGHHESDHGYGVVGLGGLTGFTRAFRCLVWGCRCRGR